jgi:hypothetical protein
VPTGNGRYPDKRSAGDWFITVQVHHHASSGDWFITVQVHHHASSGDWFITVQVARQEEKQ